MSRVDDKIVFTVSKVTAQSWLSQRSKALQELAKAAAKAFVREQKKRHDRTARHEGEVK